LGAKYRGLSNKNGTYPDSRKIGLEKQNIEVFPLTKKWDISDKGYEILTFIWWKKISTK
jgi:hypothetical protein